MTAKLNSLDPAKVWQPAGTENWDRRWAAHLFRRAGFGAPPFGFFPEANSWDALDEAVRAGRESCIDLLLAGGPGATAFAKISDKTATQLDRQETTLDDVQSWWLSRLLSTPHPLLERTTLFWHNHFATSNAKVNSLRLMLKQNMLLRKNALGSFRQMLTEMGRDLAMLIWLDSNSNVKGKPNENYAREVMELFSLGVGNYNEQDIQEAARAFTGMGTNTAIFVFNQTAHDDGEKEVLGKKGNWGGDDIVNILLEQPACARFLVRKLFHEFITDFELPPDQLIEPLAVRLRESDYDIKDCLGTMLRSQLLFSDVSYRRRVKSPVEYVLGLLNSCYAFVPRESLASLMDGLGQSLFAPPNVKGWEGGRSWLNSSTLLARHNLAWRLVGGHDRRFENAIDPAELLVKAKKKTSAEKVEFLLELFLSGDVGPAVKDKLVTFLEAAGRGTNAQDQRMREVTHAVLMMPQYQLA